MHDLSEEVHALAVDEALTAQRSQALRLEQRDIFSIRRELLVALYVACLLYTSRCV